MLDGGVDPLDPDLADVTERDIGDRIEPAILLSQEPHGPVAEHPADRGRGGRLCNQRFIDNSHGSIMTMGYPRVGRRDHRRSISVWGHRLDPLIGPSAVTWLEHLQLFPRDRDVADDAPAKSAP